MHNHLSHPSALISQHIHTVSSKIDRWRHYEATDLDRLSPNDRPQFAHYVAKFATYDEAQIRIDDLESIAHRRLSKSYQEGVKIIVMIIGAFACSTPAKILAAGTNLGALATLIGLAVGAAWAWFVDDRATKAIGEDRKCHSSTMAVKSIEQRYPVDQSHYLAEANYQARLTLIKIVESGSLHPPYRGDLYWAIVASVIEVLVAFWVSLPGGLLMACFVSAFPITLIWLTSLYEADHIEFPAWAADKVRTYSTYLPSSEVAEEDLLEVTNLEAKLQFYTAVRPDGVQTPQGAVARARQELAFQEMQGWDVAANQAEKQLKAQYQAALKEAKNKPFPQAETKGYRPFEVPPSHQTAMREREELIQQEQTEITQAYEEQLAALQKDYGRMINHWNTIRLEAIAEYDRWERNNFQPYYPDSTAA